MKSLQDRLSPLKIIGVGTGRDGTTSLTEIIRNIFMSNKQSIAIAHEWGVIDSYNLTERYLLNPNDTNQRALESLILSCDIERLSQKTVSFHFLKF